MFKYGNKWEKVDGCPLTDDSWLCVSIGHDQVWVDEVEGYVFLREGKFSPLWYKHMI